MQFEGTRRSGQAPNLTPLIDIVFLLLVFFMLTAHFVKDEGLPVTLPEAESSVPLEDKEPVIVVMNQDGQLQVNGKAVELSTLETQLRMALQKVSDKRVVIRGDELVALGHTVKILDAAKLAGAAGVDIVTQKPGSQQPDLN